VSTEGGIIAAVTVVSQGLVNLLILQGFSAALARDTRVA
jgi:hypothetical protein